MKPILTACILCAAILQSFGTEIRVRNDSGVDFKHVVVAGKNYGDIKRGAVTGYQTWESAYRYASVSLTAAGKTMRVRPIDFVGEKVLGDGNFTYVLAIQGDDLLMSAEKDKNKTSSDTKPKDKVTPSTPR